MDVIWILAEHHAGRPQPAALELASAARGLTNQVVAVMWGGQEAEVAAVLGRFGVTHVLDAGSVSDSLPGPTVATALAQRIHAGERPTAIFFPSSINGRDIAARLSVQLDLPLLANVDALHRSDFGLISSHSVFGGTQTVHARFTDAAPALFILRPKSFEPIEADGGPPTVEDLPTPELGHSDAAKVVERRDEARVGPSLDEAKIVVAAGRGIGSANNYKYIEQLAEMLDGAPAASRAIVDEGWVPYSYQVGQTGKAVRPDVYLAFGISGAVQHRVGMKDSHHVVAVNSDPSAPIFQVADVGIVGDAIQILPRLIAALRDHKGAATSHDRPT